jgi:uncharacterized protein YdiU (UPF0061 family)
MAQWNLARLAETLLPLLNPDETTALKMAHEAIDSFTELYQKYWLQGMLARLGLKNRHENDLKLINGLFSLMKKHHLDYTATLRTLTLAVVHTYPPVNLAQLSDFPDWYLAWQIRLEQETALDRQWQMIDVQNLMLAANPACIARNHLVEMVIEKAVEQKNYSPLTEFLSVLKDPFAPKCDYAENQIPPEGFDDNYKTFCGT